MKVFVCPLLQPGEVELTDEREAHIRRRHPDLLPENADRLVQAVESPDLVIASPFRTDRTTLARWFPELRGGKYVVVHIVTDGDRPWRHWIVTAYLDSSPPS